MQCLHQLDDFFDIFLFVSKLKIVIDLKLINDKLDNELDTNQENDEIIGQKDNTKKKKKLKLSSILVKMVTQSVV